MLWGFLIRCEWGGGWYGCVHFNAPWLPPFPHIRCAKFEENAAYTSLAAWLEFPYGSAVI